MRPSTPQPLSITRSAARRLLDHLDIRRPSEIKIELIAADQGALVQFRPLAHEEGHLVRTGNRGLIVVNEGTRGSEKWRFVVAHELGHFLRHPLLDQFDLCTEASLRDWYQTSGHEVEANEFAVELLMPDHLFKPRCDVERPSLEHVASLAKTFSTSLTATAIRYVQLTSECCAVVHSTRGRVDWAWRSNGFPLYIAKGHRLNRYSYAGDLFEGKTVADRPQLSDGSGWSEQERAGDVEVYEHSRYFSRFETVLTVLWLRGDR